LSCAAQQARPECGGVNSVETSDLVAQRCRLRSTSPCGCDTSPLASNRSLIYVGPHRENEHNERFNETLRSKLLNSNRFVTTRRNQLEMRAPVPGHFLEKRNSNRRHIGDWKNKKLALLQGAKDTRSRPH